MDGGGWAGEVGWLEGGGVGGEGGGGGGVWGGEGLGGGGLAGEGCGRWRLSRAFDLAGGWPLGGGLCLDGPFLVGGLAGGAEMGPAAELGFGS